MMALEDLTMDDEYIIRMALASSARITVTQLRDLEKLVIPVADTTLEWYLDHLTQLHNAYRALTGQEMQTVHREGVTYDAGR